MEITRLFFYVIALVIANSASASERSIEIEKAYNEESYTEVVKIANDMDYRRIPYQYVFNSLAILWNRDHNKINKELIYKFVRMQEQSYGVDGVYAADPGVVLIEIKDYALAAAKYRSLQNRLERYKRVENRSYGDDQIDIRINAVKGIVDVLVSAIENDKPTAHKEVLKKVKSKMDRVSKGSGK